MKVFENNNKVTLHCGDNLEFMKTLEDESIDLEFSDVLYATFIFEGSCMIFTTLRGYILRRVFLYYRQCIGLQRSSGLPLV